MEELGTLEGDGIVSRIDYGTLAHFRERWKNDPMLPEWKKERLVELLDLFRRKVEDNHSELAGVMLYYPSDCRDYDVFMTFTHTMDALIVPAGNGYVARDFGLHDEIE